MSVTLFTSICLSMAFPIQQIALMLLFCNITVTQHIDTAQGEHTISNSFWLKCVFDFQLLLTLWLLRKISAADTAKHCYICLLRFPSSYTPKLAMSRWHLPRRRITSLDSSHALHNTIQIHSPSPLLLCYRAVLAIVYVKEIKRVYNTVHLLARLYFPLGKILLTDTRI